MAHILLCNGDIFDLPSANNYIPRYRPDFSLNDIPCDLHEQKVCARPGKAYPWYGMQSYIRDNQALIKRMYGDTCERNPSQTRAQGPVETRAQYARTAVVNACPSEQFVITPFWANNSDGNALAVVNFHPFEQAVQQEICKPGITGRCRDGCLCEQKYSWYRLLAFDPRNECRGIFMDWFQFPSCCACRCYDVPSPEDQSANHTESGSKADDPVMKSLDISTPSTTVTQPEVPIARDSLGDVNTTASPATTPALETLGTTASTPSMTKVNVTSDVPADISAVATSITTPSHAAATTTVASVTTASNTVAPSSEAGITTTTDRDYTTTPQSSSTVSNATISPRSRNTTVSQTKARSALQTINPSTSSNRTYTGAVTPATSTATRAGKSDPSSFSLFGADQSLLAFLDVAIRRNRIPKS